LSDATDSLGVAADPRMPFLGEALDSIQAQGRLVKACPDLLARFGAVQLQAVRVLRYKRERRCLIEYEFTAPGSPTGSVVILGKVRAKGLDRKTFEVQQALWRKSFGPESADQIYVPEPLGVVPAFQMWLQARIPGRPATELISQPDGVVLAGRIAEGLHKLHQANASVSRSHGIAEELQILRERLALVGQANPAWTNRLEGVLAACERLAAAVPEPRARGIHRDFYPAQVLVDGTSLYLLDLDMFCHGDPALDAGNFLGHLTEQSLRTLGTPEALAEREKAFQDQFLELSEGSSRFAVDAYTTLTLVRHIYLSTQFPERRPWTQSLIALCERRLERYGSYSTRMR